MTVEGWLAAALADAEALGRQELKPLLTSLAEMTRQLRAAHWNVDASGEPLHQVDAEGRQSPRA